MERLRLSLEEKEQILNSFKNNLYKANKASELNFDFKATLTKLDEKQIIKPTFIIDKDIMDKMQALVDESNVEISWHGFVKRNKEKQYYYLYDIILFPQINTATTTTTDQNKYATWIGDLIKNPKSNFEDMRLHGHSHVNMSVFSSGIDDAYQEELLTNTDDDDFYIFIIMNKKRDLAVFIYDFTQQILFKTHEITIKVLNQNGESTNDWAKNMIKTYCSSPKPKKAWNNNLDDYYESLLDTPPEQYTKKKGIMRRWT